MSITGPDENLLTEIASSFASVAEIKAVVLSGSAVTAYGDERSDYDFYVYSDGEIDPGARREIARKYSSRFNIDNRFYETDDEWLLEGTGRQVEFIYRSRSWIEEVVERVWGGGCASVGYSTCLVYNVRHSRIYHDPESWFRQLQARTASTYPQLLRDNILKKNLPMLYSRLNGSFREQILNAVARRDVVSVNHRVSVFLASYFDVLFAANGVLHPGEKHLIRYALDTCRRLPDSFERDVEELIRCPDADKSKRLDHLIEELQGLLRRL